MGKYQLTDYFQAVERRFEKLGPEEGSVLQVEVCGNIIEMHFQCKDHADCVSSYLIVPVLKEHRKADSIFYYWTEDCTCYMPPDSEQVTAIWQSRDETGYLRIVSGFELIGTDYKRNSYYHCRQPVDYLDYMIHGHSMAPVFARWAYDHDKLLLHSACIGVDGKGVMLSARGGGGKSTLAVSCLLGGFDFVSDDYILVDQHGEFKGYPLYRIIGINQDMAAILKPDMPVMRMEERRNNKLYLDASAYDIKPELPIKAILFPHPCDIEEPQIRRTSPGTALSKVLETSARNMRVFRDPKPYKVMSERLMQLPVYEILLTRDLEKNRDYLEKFIKEEL